MTLKAKFSNFCLGDGKPPGSAPGIMQGGDDGEQGGCIQSYCAQHSKGKGCEDLAEQDREQRQDLRAGVRFAVNAGAKVAHAETDI